MSRTPSLHLNSEYTLLDSSVRISDLISYALENKMSSLVLTDHNVMYGAFEFYTECKKNDIHPVIGLELDVEDFRLVLLAKNYNGYKELLRLSSKKMNKQEIFVKEIEFYNLFIIDHPDYGYFKKTGRELEINDYFIGTTTDKLPNSVFMQSTKYINKTGARKLGLLNAIKDSLDIQSVSGDYNLLKMPESDIRVQQAALIIKNCVLEFPMNPNPFPSFKVEGNITKEKFLSNIIEESAKLHLGSKENKETYLKRIEMEYKVICELGFVDYFLIIWDLVRWAKSQNISIGPGRGSAAGSLVVYLLGVTEVDPIQYNLIFERFLNVDRVSLPDIDIDIQDNKREEVVNYLFEKYGKDSVSLISTFSVIGAKTALRDIGRIYKLPTRDVNALSKLVGANKTLDLAYSNSSRFKAAIEKNETFRNIFYDAKLIEGSIRQRGTHAAGVIVSNGKIEEKVPTVLNAEGHNQAQFTMNQLEANGLIKFDLLGLRNLTIINEIKHQIFQKVKKNVNLLKIPLNDKKTNKLLSSGNTDGIFQLESYGMKKTLKEVNVSSFNDIVAIISLFRPGPMEYIPLYKDLKDGRRKIQKISPEYDAILKSTYGIIIYQEQIMEIAKVVSNMTRGEADILRRAISKKKISVIDSLKTKFIDGAIKNGYDNEKAKKIYLMIEKFSNYGFNKSHAVAYGILAYRMAYLKAWFPESFYISLIKISTGSSEQISKYINGARAKGIVIVAPSINDSKIDAYSENNKIILPLNLIKGFGKSKNNALIEERNTNGQFTDFFDFVSRLKIKGIGEEQLSSLIAAGALREFGNFQTLIDGLPSALRYSSMITTEKNGIKYIDSNILPQPLLVEVDNNISVDIKNEIKYFGFQFSKFITSDKEFSNKLINLELNKTAEVVVLYEKKRAFKDSNDKDMAWITLSDSSSCIEVKAFNDVYKFIENQSTNVIVTALIKKNEYNNKENFILVKPWKVINE
ncbi:DNA polymerase III subunit alpha [Candidatus Mycoplasma mahonii]|uniref:DNA polymerase III subunit alpha n=1 Tax=Candidatus Mycoplasma mahonii TaxID=3004105 RepID=UPI0026EC82FD|nr:DNA polymerase III subunit alpha [Candidatus Mycoplasma mahonii]WKX02697.1 DNA polymerase III subunit alpha [Candidatus Mycoplasma mahonii]